MALNTEADLDRSEAATPHKLSEARKRGQVPKSADLVSAIVFTSAAAYLYAQGRATFDELLHLDRHLLVLSAGGSRNPTTPWWLWDLVEHSVRSAAFLLLPSLATIVMAAILANLAQTGPVLSLHPVKPDWQRINPRTGLRRVFSPRTLFDGMRALIKLAVLVTVIYHAVLALAPQFSQITGLTPLAHTRVLLSDLMSVAMKIALALCLIALFDLGYTRREYTKNMRMSRRELKDEFKNREGDPRIRSRLRELRREMLKRSLSVRRTAQADVVITNPTHVAVALRYSHGQMGAPVVLSKGVGGVAAVMRLIAVRHHIPVVRSPVLARALHAGTNVDHQIPQEFFADTARIMVWVLAMRASRRPAKQSAERA